MYSFSEHMQLFHPEHAEEILKSLGHEVVAGRGGAIGGGAIGGGGAVDRAGGGG